MSHMQLVLQPTTLVKDSQKPVKDLLAILQIQDLGLGIFSPFLID